MKLPEKVKPGQAIKAEDFNDMIDFMRSLMIQPGSGYTRKHTTGGTVLNINQKNKFTPPRINPPFSVISVTPGGSYTLRLEPGRVHALNPKAAAQDPAGDGLDSVVPTINGTAMDVKDSDGLFPGISVTDGQWIFCKIERDEDGILVGTPEIVVEDDDEDSAHYQPGNGLGSGGTPERYQMQPICQFHVTAGEVSIDVWRRSDIDMGPDLNQIKNIGNGSDLYKGWNAPIQRLELRRISGDFGLVDSLNGDSVELDFDGENVGTPGSSYSAEVFVTPDANDPNFNGKAQFRRIDQGADSDRRQIQVSQDGQLVRVQGNGNNGTMTFVDCNLVEQGSLIFEDGLLKQAVNATLQLGDCAGGSNTGTWDVGTLPETLDFGSGNMQLAASTSGLGIINTAGNEFTIRNGTTTGHQYLKAYTDAQSNNYVDLAGDLVSVQSNLAVDGDVATQSISLGEAGWPSFVKTNDLDFYITREATAGTDYARFISGGNTIRFFGNIGVGKDPDASSVLSVNGDVGAQSINLGEAGWPSFVKTNDLDFYITREATAGTDYARFIAGSNNVAFFGNLEINGSAKIGNDTDGASAANVGAIRYREDANASYVDMVMKTSTFPNYAWVNIKTTTFSS